MALRFDEIQAVNIKNFSGTTSVYLATTGNVGIGTASPNANAKLHLYNSASATDVALRLTSNANSKTLIGFGDTVDQTAGAIKYDNATSEMSFEVLNSTEAMRIDSSGNVGIGTTNPFANASSNTGLNVDTGGHSSLLIGDGVNDGGMIQSSDNSRRIIIGANVYDSPSGSWSRFVSSGAALIDVYGEGGTPFISFNVDSTTSGFPTARMFINSSGNVGIGTTSPTARLDVQGPTIGNTSGNTALHAVIQGIRHHLDFEEERTADGSDWANTTFRLGMRVDVVDHQSIDFVSDSINRQHIDIRTGNRAFHSRFTYDGKLGIGTASPSSTLTVNGTIEILSDDIEAANEGGHLTIRASSNGSKRWNIDNYTDDLRFFTQDDDTAANGDVKMIILDSGRVGIGTTSPGHKLEVNGGSSDNVLAELKSGNASTSGYSEMHITNNAGVSLNFGSIGSNYTNSEWAGMRYMYATDGDLALKAIGSGHNVRIYAGSASNEVMRMTSTGGISFGSSGNAYGTSGQVLTSNGNTSPTWQDSLSSANTANLIGWEPAYSNTNYNTVIYNHTEKAVELNGDTDTYIGMSYKAVRIKGGETKRFTISVKSDTNSSSGMYLRLAGVNGDLPDGKTHISNNGSGGSVFVDNSDYVDHNWVENIGATTSWRTFERDYTASADGYISVYILNWSGMGTASLYVKQPDIQTVQVGSATNLSGLGYIQSTSSGTSYQNNVQVRENLGGGSNTAIANAPQLGFHWSGVAASNILMESSGRISIRNNPGTGYEDFIADNITANSTVYASGGIARQSGGSTTAGVKFWSGTKAQYDALGSGRDTNTVYYVTDE